MEALSLRLAHAGSEPASAPMGCIALLLPVSHSLKLKVFSLTNRTNLKQNAANEVR